MIHAPWYRVYSADFLSATRMMKASEVGIYAILQNLMHDRQGPILYDPIFLARYCNTSKMTLVNAVDRLVGDGLFSLKDGRLWSPYIQRQLENCKEKGEKARSAANVRHKKTKENQSSGDADAMQYQKQTSDTDAEGKTPKGSSPSTTRSRSSPAQPDHKQDTRSAAPDSASAASSDNRASNGDVMYILAILQERGLKEAVLDKIWRVHEARGLSMAMLDTIQRMASEGRLTEAEVKRVAGGPNA